MTQRSAFDAVIIGAGFSGLALLHHLREIGLDCAVVEASDGVGGTWQANRYPGVRTDSEFHYYSFSFSKEVREEWTWSERYPGGKEVLAYLNFVADRLDLRKDIQLRSRVSSAVWDEDSGKWTVELEDGRTLTGTYLLSGMGVLSQPVYPAIPGIESFTGECYHTADWPREGADLAGKRVGLIGLGASGIQVVPVVAKQAGEFFVFQRTPNYVVETTNEQVSPEQMRHVRENYDEIFEQAAGHPFGVAMEPARYSALEVGEDQRREIFESKWEEGGFHFANECFTDLASNHEASELASEFIRGKIREIVRDPDTAELLCPKNYSFNGKRVPTGHDYYATFNRDNVHLVDVKTTPITEVTPRGLKVGEREYELDVLIVATGFDAMTGTLTTIDIVGRDGIVLRDKWDREGLRTNLGISVHGFPNFFMSLGPQTPYSNLPVPIQLGAQWLQRLLSWARDNDVPLIEATAESEQWWVEECERAGEATVMSSEGEKAGAWFLGKNVPGKPKAFQVYMGGGQVYQEFCRAAEQDEYRSFRADLQVRA
ncbi:steroid monooxygenase [Prauserella marina]|uniref:Predicted flavoprotein CzcO associated with the cation diffusion facilitator CzcD n=1 Tax=Prauserella marina TaxID=530584 RepID=A0A222VMU6_9PSEU|nr:NAD(P)/FAD-dependent oxidoreductase [Prauserella marina]ASR35246.1 steroid monooxygenase [Prauserella marina]PWV84978.1 cation diffusion facilitator CzcD-associated flavoprotein CzcO [Prauserella marina]SDC07784.1 Predicted flavoprotein CzcO associated with the cation diffusion facilitator CzcD [Prauserella marina]